MVHHHRYKAEWTVIIRMRVIDVLKQWVDRYFARDFLPDRVLTSTLVSFAVAQSQADNGPPVDGALDAV